MMYRRHTYITDIIIIYTAIFSVSYCDDVQKIELFFNSHNCDEFSRRISEDKEYTLTWLGKTEPKLCHFNFTGGGSSESYRKYKVCFESVEMDLPHFDMELLVQNNTEKWEFDAYVGSIEETCVKKAYKMMFKIVLGNNHKESSSYVLKLKITAQKLPEEDEDVVNAVLTILGNAVETIIPIAIVVIVVFCFCRNKQARERLCSTVTNVIDRCYPRSSSPREPSCNNDRGSVILSTTDNENQQLEISEFTRLQDSTDPPDPQHVETTDRSSREFTAPPPSYEDVLKMQI